LVAVAGETGARAPPAEAPAERLRAALAGMPLFGGVAPATLDRLVAEMRWVALPGGTTLMEAGEAGDEAYLVLSGLLGVQARDGSLIARIGPGDSVGEMALLTGERRSASVLALRDCEIAVLPANAFREAAAADPALALTFARGAVQRLAAATAVRPQAARARSLALVPHGPAVDVAGFAVELVEALAPIGRVELVWAARGTERSTAWFHEVEARNDFVVYAAEHLPNAWTRLCVRQADALLLLARADEPAGEFGALEGCATAARRSELVLLHDRGVAPGRAAGWRRGLGGTPVHHVARPADSARVARLVTGRGVGLVLSGGGARGFAHLGVVRALREAGVPIDLVGGTSMGAIMGAGVAAGWQPEEMLERFARAFVSSNPLSDFTLPLVSLVAGREVGRRLRAEFGDVSIEDLPLPFYCVSANLSAGRAQVHDSGPLWHALRASVAIPGVLPPVISRGEVLVDGGTMNNLPVDVMRAQGRGPVIGVDVGADRAFTSDLDEVDLPRLWDCWRQRRRRPGILQILWRAGMVNSAQDSATQRDLADLLLRPPLESVDLLDWRAFGRAIDIGYRAAVEALADGGLARLAASSAAVSASATAKGTLRSSTSPSASAAR
jgi:NTE family protein